MHKVIYSLKDLAWDNSYNIVRRHVNTNTFKLPFIQLEVNNILFDPKHFTIWELNDGTIL